MKDTMLYFEVFEDGHNALFVDTEELSIKAVCDAPEDASVDFGYLTLKQAILGEVGFLGCLLFPYDECEDRLAADASAEVDVDLNIEIRVPLYRIIDKIEAGDMFESDIYTDKDAAISDCQSEWDTLTVHDQNRREVHYVAEYDSLEAAQEVLADHSCIYDSFLTWADNLLNYTGLNRKEFCAKYNIPYGTFEKWQYGSRECPEYVKELLERVVRLDF